MAHFVGKINIGNLLGVRVTDVLNEEGTEEEKCLIVPIRRNGIKHWNNEWQLWFRAYGYREPKGFFTHFLMKYIPFSAVKKLSQQQLETFVNHHLGGMCKTTNEENIKKEKTKKTSDDDFIQKNL